ncbi:hypothetical protein ACIQZB_42245 [Streptomyces sp. NPDC097727]|uniref:hypothetical protein n=1 Tax=Streptomyces sp. NPDC097727 TaxID=3366092 RepID=UPI00380087BC
MRTGGEMFSSLRTRVGNGRRRPGRTLRPALAAGIGVLLISCTPATSVRKDSAVPVAPVHTGASGRVYVTNQQDDTLSVIDASTYKVVATVPAGVAPEGVAVAKDGKHVYIANSGSARVSVLDTRNTRSSQPCRWERAPPVSASAPMAASSTSPTAVRTTFR